ncbi:MAG: SO2930 family diheme c-type cytochrome [Hyphomonadaceae bacterium]|nr:SO2930 family diheme c-type cytochrome [Hyphomonadaceae bacterium]
MRRALAAAALALLVGAAPQARGARADGEGPNLSALLADAPSPLLSAYGLFRDPAAQAPNTGVTAYDVATPLFSDGALKRRFVYLPPGAQAVAAGEDVLDFPVGATLVKTFAFPADLRAPDDAVRLIETRLLIRRRDGWASAVYLWDADGREARLHVAGARVPVTTIDADGAARTIDYSVPNKNQCKGCHAVDGALAPIGPRPRHLDTGDQLARWAAAGLVDAPLPRTPRPATLDAAARAYLDVNCAHCHNPRGPAGNSGLDLRFEQDDPARWGVNKRPVAAGRASGGHAFAIAPGAPDRSILLHRMESDDPGVMMPELGRTIVDREGVELVRRWIAAMDASGAIPQDTPHP